MENNVENIENEEKSFKNGPLIITVLIMIVLVLGGTFAWLVLGLNVTNGNYLSEIHCFNIDYTIGNGDQGNTQDMTGTLFPTDVISDGINGRVGLKVNDSCDLNGIGTLLLHVDSSIDNALLTPVASYCEDRSTLEAVNGYETKAACETAGYRWQGYGDDYCENANTLQRLTDYTTQSDCTTNGGTWITSQNIGSPLKYAVYNSTDLTQNPVSVGHISTTDKGNDVTLYNNFSITKTQQYYYVYIWLDGYLTSNSAANLPFVGSISASANQSNTVPTP